MQYLFWEIKTYRLNLRCTLQVISTSTKQLVETM